MLPAEIGTKGMVQRVSGINVSVGFASDTGARQRNEDFAGAVFGNFHFSAVARWDADSRSSQGQRDARLMGMGCTFTALVLRGRTAHVLHVGDTRAYRFSRDRLTLLTEDHVRQAGTGRSNILVRALGVETELRLDYTSQPVAQHDRFLLCCDGVHGSLANDAIAEIMRERVSSEDSARALVAAALDAGSTDNCTALVLDVVGLETAVRGDIGANIVQLPMIPLPQGGETIDGFVLKVLLSEGRYTRLFGAEDEVEGGEVALKFPKPQVASADTYRAAFMREAWVGARVTSPWLGHIIELPPGRQSCLYTVMPLYQGELLETRLARRPGLGLEEGRNIAIKLSRAAAALHRAGIIHRDIKPDNVILEREGSLKLIDLGVVRIPGMEDFPPEDIPGTPAYMAPEMFDGEAGNEATDIYALGVTMFRAFTGEFPYGNADATSPPRRDRPTPLSALRPDLPAWLQAALGRAVATDAAERYRDMAEFAVEMEAGPESAPPAIQRPRTLYERNPTLFWQGVAVLLALALLVTLLRR